MNTTFQLLFAAAQFNQAVTNFLEFLLIVTLLLGIAIILSGSFSIARGNYGDGMASVTAGFLCCMTVPIIRLFAGWLGVSI